MADKVELIPECAFGSARFIEIVRSRDIDIFCHHAAEVGDYRNPGFDITTAVAANTLNLRAALKAMVERGGKGAVLTGSYFEYDEGAGSQPRLAVSAVKEELDQEYETQVSLDRKPSKAAPRKISSSAQT